MDMAATGDHTDLDGHGSPSSSMYVVQLTATGQLDPSFGVGGVVKGVTSYDVALADQSDGKVVVSSLQGITRFLANGSLDTTFGTGGTVTWPPLGYYIPFAIEVDPLGRFVIGGWQQIATGIAFNVIRLTSAGALDSSFGVGGIGTSGNLVNLDTYKGSVSMALQPDGKTVLASSIFGFPDSFAVARFTGDSPLLAASLPAHAVTASITSDQLQPLLAEAEARWQAA